MPLQGHKYDVNSVAFSPDGTRIVSASHDGTLRLWDAKSAEPVGKLLQAHDWVYCAAFSPDGTRIASGSAARKLRLWDANSGEVLVELELDSSLRAVAWHRDRLATGESSGAVQVFRVIEPDRPA